MPRRRCLALSSYSRQFRRATNKPDSLSRSQSDPRLTPMLISIWVEPSDSRSIGQIFAVRRPNRCHDRHNKRKLGACRPTLSGGPIDRPAHLAAGWQDAFPGGGHFLPSERCRLKKSVNSCPQRSAITPASTSARWLSRMSSSNRKRLLTAPALGSSAP